MSRGRLEGRRPGGVTVAMIAGLLAIAVVLGVSLSARHPSVIGDNGHGEAVGVVSLAPRQHVCQRELNIPAGTNLLSVGVGTGGAPHGGALSLLLQPIPTPGAPPAPPLASGELSSIRGQVADLPVRPALTHPVDALVCLGNAGRGTLVLIGEQSAVSPALSSDTGAFGLIGFRYARNQHARWWSRLGTLAARFPLAKAPFFGAWTMWAVLVAVAAICAVALVGLQRVLRP
jgi:hypothetical protein